MVLRIAYFGLPLAAVLLARDGHALCSAVISPGKPAGTRRLERAGVPVVAAESFDAAREAELLARLERDRPDLLVSWFWTRRLSSTWLALPRRGALGVHPSLLPRHRGPDPYFWAIDSGDSETGVSVHLLEPEYDTGAVLDVERIPVGERTSWQLARALDRPSLRALRRVVSAYASGEPPPPVPQDETRATRAPQPTGALLRVQWEWPTERVLRRIRALSPVPGLALELFGARFFVTRARPADAFTPALVPGEVELRPDALVARTGDGALVVERATLDDDSETPTELTGSELAARFAELCP